MKVLNLRCARDHRFEGWVASDDDWLRQREQQLVECPMCGDGAIERLPSAPHIARLGGAGEPASKQEVVRPTEAQALWLRAVRHVIENTEDVGERFAEEARRIHYGEAESRGIRGQASSEDSAALAAEGIEVVPLPIPPALKGPVQ
jgi:hypothetical protein